MSPKKGKTNAKAKAPAKKTQAKKAASKKPAAKPAVKKKAAAPAPKKGDIVLAFHKFYRVERASAKEQMAYCIHLTMVECNMTGPALRPIEFGVIGAIYKPVTG